MISWLSLIGGIVTLLVAVIGWWKERKIRLEERRRYEGEAALLRARLEAAVQKAVSGVAAELAERKKVDDAEFAATGDDPDALRDLVNRRL